MYTNIYLYINSYKNWNVRNKVTKNKLWNNSSLLFQTCLSLFWTKEDNNFSWGNMEHEQAEQFIFKIHLPTDYHIHLIIIQEHSIICHLPLPQSTGSKTEF